MADCLLFQSSFKLGAKMMAEVMKDNQNLAESWVLLRKEAVPSFLLTKCNYKKFTHKKNENVCKNIDYLKLDAIIKYIHRNELSVCDF